ncbi:PAS sensor protein [Candidatus Magnetoovum chiemensis]|nr:PAS sensor protein [Candidatus Magnetoovum chiemensis]
MFFDNITQVAIIYKNEFLTVLFALTSIYMYLMQKAAKKKSKSLVSSNKSYSKVIASITDGVVIVDNAGVIRFVNPAAEAILGKRREALIGETFGFPATVGESTEIDIVRKAVSIAAKETQDSPISTELGAELAIVEMRVGSTEWEGRKAFIASLRDITKRKKIETQLKSSEQFIRTVLNSISEAICIINVKDFTITGYNKVFFEEFGLRDNTIIGKQCHEIMNLSHKICTFSDDSVCPLLDSIELDKPVCKEQKYINNKGERIYVEVSTSPIRDDNGRVVQVVHVSRDITERKRQEQEIREKTHQLEELNINLESRIKKEMKTRLEQQELLIQQSKMASMGEMLNSIAHQWRQPLNFLALLIQDIEEAYEFGELNSGYLKEHVEKAMRQIEFMSETINDFRDFFKPSKKKSVFDVKSSIESVVSLLCAQLKSNSISVSISCRSNNDEPYKYLMCDEDKVRPESNCLTKVYGYENEFKHSMVNIINNARDAILENKKHDSPKKNGDDEILIDIYNSGSLLIIEIKDSGTGIPEDVIDNIFEPYFTTKKDGHGTGIGLYMTKVIIEQNMDGKIYVSNIEKGAMFTIELNAFK